MGYVVTGGLQKLVICFDRFVIPVLPSLGCRFDNPVFSALGFVWARWFLLTLVVFQGTTWGGKGSGKGISVLAGRIVPFCVLSRALCRAHESLS